MTHNNKTSTKLKYDGKIVPRFITFPGNGTFNIGDWFAIKPIKNLYYVPSVTTLFPLSMRLVVLVLMSFHANEAYN